MRTTTPKPRGAAVVERVLEVTLEELGRVGLARLSLPRIAELSGINKTSLYRRWPTKQALVAAALERCTPSAAELPDHGSLALDLAALARALGAFLRTPAGVGVLRTVLAEGDAPETRRLAKAMWSSPARVAPRAVLERALARGELRPDAELDLVLYTLAGATLHRVLVERRAPSDAWARGLARLLTQGVTTEQARGDVVASPPRRHIGGGLP